MFLRKLKIKVKGREYSYWRVVETYWDKEKKQARHKTILNLGELKEEQVNQIRAILFLKKLGAERFFTTLDQIKIKQTYEFLVPSVLNKLWQLWELDRVTDTGQILKVSSSLMSRILTINRAISPSSDLKVCDWYQGTILPQLLKIAPKIVNPTRIYRTLDKLLQKEREILKHLATKVKELGFDDLSLVFYDLTSSYFEGWSCPLGEFGLSRDHRKDKLQLLLALAVTKEGFPFYWRVLPGGLHDSVTVKETIADLKESFKLKTIIVVMDKGLVTQTNLSNLEKNKFFYLVTIGRHQIKKLPDFPHVILTRLAQDLEKEGEKQTPNLKGLMANYPYFTYFSNRAYFHELKKDGIRRYILCFNPEKFSEERRQRQEKIDSITNYFAHFNQQLKKAKYSKDKRLLEKEIYAYLKKRKAESLFKIKLISKRIIVGRRTITTYHISFLLDENKLAKLKLSDGIYCLLTNLAEDRKPSFLISSYRQRRRVEVAFSYLKGFIEIRPFYHQKAQRVKSHILICILGYLLQVTVEYLLRKNGYNITFQEFYRKTSNVRAIELEIANIKKKKLKLTEVPPEVVALLETLSSKDILLKTYEMD